MRPLCAEVYRPAVLLRLVRRKMSLFRFYLDREHISPARSGGGVVRATASLGDGSGLDGYVVAGTTTTPGGVEVMATVEERQLLESGVDHIQVYSEQQTVDLISGLFGLFLSLDELVRQTHLLTRLPLSEFSVRGRSLLFVRQES